MEKKRDLPKADLISKILVRLPVVSLLRFKAVSKSWYALIESSSFIDLHTTAATFKSSSSKFGSFILNAAVEFPTFRENALLMLSSVSDESECVSKSRSWCSESFGLWSTGFNGICDECDSGSDGLHWTTNVDGVRCLAIQISGGCGGGFWWRTNDGLCGRCKDSHNFVEEEEDDQKMDSFLLGGVSNDDDELVLKLYNLGFPSCYNFGNNMIDIVGSCNGLICLHERRSSDVSLWNPATRQFRILPKSSSITIDVDSLPRLFAFGFDAETKDYKVLLLSGLRLRERIIDDDALSVGPMECHCRVQVYSLSTDSWSLLGGIKVLPGSPFSYPDSSAGVLYLNGSCFFMAKFLSNSQLENNDRFIISLDLTKEIIIPIQLPHHELDHELYLCYVGKKIALFTQTKLYHGTDCWERFHIWVLNEHYYNSSCSMTNESWTKFHSFQIKHGLPVIKHGLPGEWMIPRGISNDGVFVLLETGIPGLGNKKKMKLYNLVTKELKKNFVSCDQVLSKAYAYKPSLVSIQGGNGSTVIGKAAC